MAAINEARLIKKFLCLHCRDPLNTPLALDCGHLVCSFCIASCPKCPKCYSLVLHRPESCTLLDILMDVLFRGRYHNLQGDIMELAKITTEDKRKELLNLLICNICKKLVIDPVIPNCGHVYCKYCANIATPSDKIFRCLTSPSIHRDLNPTICDSLNYFLVRYFAKEYAMMHPVINTTWSPEERAPWWSPITLIHRDTRCEYCKVNAITGDSYRCVTCEKGEGMMKGFAYCSRCFEIFPFQPRCAMLIKSGDHKFELVPPVKLRDKILKSAAMQIESHAAEGKPVVFVESWKKYRYTFEGAEDEEQIIATYPWK